MSFINLLNFANYYQENASHHRVVQLMGEAGLRGQVTMILRRRNQRSVNYNSSFYQQQQIGIRTGACHPKDRTLGQLRLWVIVFENWFRKCSRFGAAVRVTEAA